MIVADSDVLIDGLRGGKRAAARIAAEIEAGTLATTVIAVFELLAGATSKAQRTKVEALLSALRILRLDEPASREAAQVQRVLARKGTPIALADCLIAGICLANSALLPTRNRPHFERFDGLRLE